MRGNYNLTGEEQDLYTGTIQTIIERLCSPFSRRTQIELSKLDIAPCNVDDILKNGTLGAGDLKTQEKIITMLDAGTSYLFNIIVEDKDGKKYCYNPIKVQTKSAE